MPLKYCNNISNSAIFFNYHVHQNSWARAFRSPCTSLTLFPASRRWNNPVILIYECNYDSIAAQWYSRRREVPLERRCCNRYVSRLNYLRSAKSSCTTLTEGPPQRSIAIDDGYICNETADGFIFRILFSEQV